MEAKSRITNEEINRKFKNQFELVNYAIKLAENMLRTGRDPRIKSDTQNRALQILEEIITGKDQFDELPIQPVAEVIVSTKIRERDWDEGKGHSDKKRSSSRNSQKNLFADDDKPKRGRKILID